MPNHAALIAELEAATVGTLALSVECLSACGYEQLDGGRWSPGRNKFGNTVALVIDPTCSLDDAIRWMTPEKRDWWQLLVGTYDQFHRHTNQTVARFILLYCAECLKARAGD